MTTTKKISELPDTGPLDYTEEVPLVQDGATRKTTIADFRDGLSEEGHHHVLADITDAGTAAAKSVSFFATAAQGAKADTAVQPGDLGSAAHSDTTAFATAAQGAKADSAIQPAALGSAAYVATSTFATAAQGAKADTAIQPAALGSAAYVASSTFATAAQGTKADTAIQPAALGSAAYVATTTFATAAQGTKADSAVQLASLAAVATAGTYNSLTNTPYPGLINAVINGGCQLVRRADKTLGNAYQFGPVDLFAVKADGTVTAGAITKVTGNFSLSAATGCGSYLSNVTITGTGVVYWRYRIEAKNAWAFYNQAAYFSARSLQDTGSGKTATITIRKANALDDFSATTQIATGTVSLVNNTIADAFLSISSMGDCHNGIEIEYKIACGAVTTKNFYLAEVQLTVGTIKRSFECRPISLELALAERYLRVCSALHGIANSASVMQVQLYHPNMRVAPTYELTGATDFTDGYTADYSQTAATIYAVNESTANHGRVSLGDFSGMTAGRFYFQKGTANVALASAEL